MNNTFWICLFALTGLGISYAQEKQDLIKTKSLDEVVLSDSRFALKRENSGKTVIKITREEIENNQGISIAQLINTKSGIEINGSRSVAGQNLGYFVRGGNNRQVLVVIDGLAVNDPSLVSNEFDLRLIDLNTIESIEIIKGAASILYGNAAATAVINIITKKVSKDTIAASFLSIVGTNQPKDHQDYDGSSFTNHVSVNGTLSKLIYLVSFGHQFSDGLSAAKSKNPEKDPFSRINTNVKLGFQFSKRFNINTFISYDKFDTAIDGFDLNNSFVDTDDESHSTQTRLGISPKYNYKNGSLHVNTAFTEIERETISVFSTKNDAKSLVIDAYNKYKFGNKLYTIVGLFYGEYNSIFGEEQSYTNTDPYTNLVFMTDFGLTLNAGTRFNNHSEYGTQWVYNLNPSFKVNIDKGYVKLFASYATSFIAPNLSQLFGFFGANPNLEPEENRTIEGGLEYNSKKGLRLSTVFFNREEENRIIFTSAYVNAQESATLQGVEIEVESILTQDLSLTANYSFTEVIDGERLRLPKHKANANLNYKLSKKTYAAVNYQYLSNRFDLGNSRLDAFSLLDLYMSHKILSNRLKLFARINNVFNEDYLEISGYSTLGRNVSIGFNLNL